MGLGSTLNYVFAGVNKVRAAYWVTGFRLIMAVLLIGCLFNVSKDYYLIIRMLFFGYCVWLAYTEYYKGVYIAAVPAAICVILFNPVIKLYLPQYQWLVIYATLAIVLIGWVVYELYLLDKARPPKNRLRKLRAVNR